MFQFTFRNGYEMVVGFTNLEFSVFSSCVHFRSLLIHSWITLTRTLMSHHLRFAFPLCFLWPIFIFFLIELCVSLLCKQLNYSVLIYLCSCSFHCLRNLCLRCYSIKWVPVSLNFSRLVYSLSFTLLFFELHELFLYTCLILFP